MTRALPLRAILLSGIIILSVLGAPVAAGTIQDDGSTSALTSEMPRFEVTTYSASENVSIWERAIFPFRATNNNATEIIDIGTQKANLLSDDDTGNVSLHKDSIGIYQTGSTVKLNLSSTISYANVGAFSGESQLIIAKMSPTGEGNLSALPSTLGEAQSLLTDNAVNENVTFMVEPAPDLGGSLSTTHTFTNGPGVYAFFLATNPANVSVTDGNLTTSGQITIVGMDGVLVEDPDSDVDAPSSVVRGNTASFDVTISDSVSQINHTLVLYKQSTVQNSKTVYKLDKISTDVSSENLTIYSEIGSVNGVAEFDGPVTILGTTINDSQTAGSQSLTTLVDHIVEIANNETSLNQNGPTVNTGDVQLDASAVGIAKTAPDRTLTVETFGNWSTGTYKWIHVAADGNDVYTATGTLSITTAPSPGGGGGGDVTPPADDDEEEQDGGGVPPVTPPEQQVTVNKTDGQVTVTIQNPAVNKTIQVDLPTDAINQTGYGLTRLNLTFTQQTSFRLNVSAASAAAAPGLPAEQTIGYLNITHSPINGSITETVTFEFTVREDRLNATNLEPNEVALYRYSNEQWSELPTEFVGSSNGIYHFTATSPGLSTFAIAQKGTLEPQFTVTGISVTPESPTLGESVAISATITNTGSAAGSYTATLLINGNSVASKDVYLEPGATKTATFTYTFETQGSYTIEVGNRSVSVTVAPGPTVTTTPAPTTTPGPTTTVGTTPPGEQKGGNLGLIIAVIVILLAAAGYLIYQREQ